MRSRRSVIRARLADRSALRSARLSLGPASDLRRARASEDVIGAGAIGPFFVFRLDSLRLGVGRPLGPVLRDPRGAVSAELAASAAVGAAAFPPESSSWPFLRPISFTVARLLRGPPAPELAWNALLLDVRQYRNRTYAYL